MRAYWRPLLPPSNESDVEPLASRLAVQQLYLWTNADSRQREVAKMRGRNAELRWLTLECDGLPSLFTTRSTSVGSDSVAACPVVLESEGKPSHSKARNRSVCLSLARYSWPLAGSIGGKSRAARHPLVQPNVAWDNCNMAQG
jgi:hypothetical protein